MSPGLRWDEAWPLLLREYGNQLAQYGRAIRAAWVALHAQLQALERVSAEMLRDPLSVDSLESLHRCFRQAAAPLLADPVRAWSRAVPQQTVLAALTGMRTFLDDVLRQSPETLAASDRELAETLGPLLARGWWRLRVRRSNRPKALAFRAAAAAHLEREELARAALDGEFQLLLSRASLHLVGAWHIFRQWSLDFSEDATEAHARADRARIRWLRWKAMLERQAGRLIERYELWLDGGAPGLAESLLARPSPKAGRTARARQETLVRYYTYWSRQQRAVQAVLDLEVTLARLAERAVARSEAALDSLDEEHSALLAELDSALEWLRRCHEEGCGKDWPSEQAPLLSADARVAQLARDLEELTRDELPESIETIDPKRALPGWREPWRRIHPEAVVFQLQERSTLDGLREAEAAHRAVIREMERAREVVLYSAEVAREEGAEGAAVAAEGVANALGLLEYHRQHVQPVRPIAERGLTRGLAAGFLAVYIALDQGRLGVLRHLFQDASERGLERVSLLVLRQGRRVLLGALKRLRRLWDRFLYGLGLKTPPQSPQAAVFRTGRLHEVLAFRLVRPELPLIYRRLFRLEPVTDPRFLVGRDDEMAGLVEARAQWLAGKPVSILLVGARGSGKTSLLNCAEQVAFQNLPIVRRQFRERIIEPAAIEEFLGRHLEAAPHENLAAAIQGPRRVVVLEEVERTFLRRVGGFGAIRFLLDLVMATRREVLWVFALNETSYHHLDRVVQIERFFTHRVNAMSVRLEEIRDAILMRHNLSGYRLAFPAPPKETTYAGRTRQWLGLQAEPREVFFELLYQQAGGIFRAAFELWQQQIERIEGGVVHLRQLVEPRYRTLLQALSLEDCFTLHAILQHGGLTAPELAEVFNEPVEAGRSRLERLLALEILEPDPTAPGFRVQPEGGHLVREALHRQNLY
mgnify:CR=1 FL=1